MKRDRFYIVVTDQGNSLKYFDIKNFHLVLTQTKGVKAWWHRIASMYILRVNNDVTSHHIVELIQNIAPEIECFVSEINFNNYSGWLPLDAWDWIYENSKN